MKLIFRFFMLLLFLAFINDSKAQSSFTDPRDGQEYKTLKMADGKIWMAENLNYSMYGSSCYFDDSSNCSESGRLYTWSAAQDACPSGWHLPDRDEWSDMFSYENRNIQRLMNGYGFNLQFGGYALSSGRYSRKSTHGIYWTSSNSWGKMAYYYGFNKESGKGWGDDQDKNVRYSCRCVKN